MVLIKTLKTILFTLVFTHYVVYICNLTKKLDESHDFFTLFSYQPKIISMVFIFMYITGLTNSRLFELTLMLMGITNVIMGIIIINKGLLY